MTYSRERIREILINYFKLMDFPVGYEWYTPALFDQYKGLSRHADEMKCELLGLVNNNVLKMDKDCKIYLENN